MSVTTEQFRIGELARRAGSTPRAVRYYEELGLLPERGRARGGHRLYDAERRGAPQGPAAHQGAARPVAERAARLVRGGVRASRPARALEQRRVGRRRDAPRDRAGGAAAHRDADRAGRVAPGRARGARGRADREAAARARDPARARRRGRMSTTRRTSPAPGRRPPRATSRIATSGSRSRTRRSHADHDDQLVDRPDRAPRHLPRHPSRPAAARQYELPAVDDDGLHGRHGGAGGDVRPDRRHVRPRAHVQPRPGRVHRLLDPALGDVDDRVVRPRCG